MGQARLIAHADWGSCPGKRWVTLAIARGTTYVVTPPSPVGDLADFFDGILALERSGPGIVAGFDFPIGLPVGYCDAAGISTFLDALPVFGTGLWKDFYSLASNPAELSVHRPFYPATPGGRCQAQLTAGLGAAGMASLMRICDLANSERPAACSLFWTLGANQVGRGAITGWRDLISPAIEKYGQEFGIWPFHGTLGSLLDSRRIIVAETYPKDVFHRLGFPRRGWSKRNQSNRAARASAIFEWTAARLAKVELDQELIPLLRSGFGPSPAGEDMFDSVIGLLGMLDVLLAGRPDGAPPDGDIQQREGWILGQSGFVAESTNL